MPNVSKVLGQSAPAATSLTTIYTCPTTVGSFTTISSATICNRGVTGTFRIAIIPNGGSLGNESYLYYDVALDANDTFVATIGITVSEADTVRVYASHADMTFQLFGVEYEPTEAELPTAVYLGAYREVLAANRTYYVRTDGNDSNTGLINDAAGAFLTVQKAVDVICDTLDIGGKLVTVQVADGTYTTPVVLRPVVGGQKQSLFSSGPWKGVINPNGGGAIIVGNTTTPSSVVFSTTNASAVGINGGQWTLKSVEVRTTTDGNGVVATDCGVIALENVHFGACYNAHMLAMEGGVITTKGDYTISGSAQYHAVALHFATVQQVESATITLTGTPAFTYYAFVYDLGVVQFANLTFSGSATGTRYLAGLNGVIQTNGSSTYLPGSVAGTTQTGGQYG